MPVRRRTQEGEAGGGTPACETRDAGGGSWWRDAGVGDSAAVQETSAQRAFGRSMPVKRQTQEGEAGGGTPAGGDEFGAAGQFGVAGKIAVAKEIAGAGEITVAGELGAVMELGGRSSARPWS